MTKSKLVMHIRPFVLTADSHLSDARLCVIPERLQMMRELARSKAGNRNTLQLQGAAPVNSEPVNQALGSTRIRHCRSSEAACLLMRLRETC